MSDNYTRQELLDLGFATVGDNPVVSRDVRFYAIEGSIGNDIRIDSYSILTGNIELGDNVHISPFCFLSATGGKIAMAANSGIGSHVALLTRSDDYAAPDLANHAKLEGDITIGKRTIVGTGCKIFPGITVGHDVSIGANCAVASDIKAGDVVISRGAALITVSNRLES